MNNSSDVIRGDNFTMEQNKEKVRLDEVTLMRTILAVLIVFMHSFTCYQGSWAPPEGYLDIPLYKWIARLSFAFTLEAFVFISGYLFAFQRITLGRRGGGISLIISKLKRLILPSIIFSILYFFLFCDYKGVGNTVYSVINGCGHMWYLPMLFWCFIGGWLLEESIIHDRWKLVFLFILNIFTIINLPFRLSAAFSFMFYFYGGFLCYKHADKIKRFAKPKHIVVLWFIFIVLFVLLRPMRDILLTNDSQSIYLKLLVAVANNGCHMLYASWGLMAFYITILYFVQRHQLRPFAIKLSSCCFGIYLFQQFVLQLLFYHTNFPTMTGPYWLPWCGFVLAAAVSYFLSDLLLRTKTGQFLIG